MLCSHSSNVVGNVDVWGMEHTLEESFNDIDNHDLDETLSRFYLFTTSRPLAEHLFFFERNSKKVRFTYGIIRAPPKYNI